MDRFNTVPLVGGASDSPFMGEWFKGHHGDVLKRLSELQRRISYQFQDQTNLLEALTHRSVNLETARRHVVGQTASNEIPWNERLEFLGDGVLGLSISSELMKMGNRYDEGMLSKVRAALVSEPSLAEIAREIDLGKYLILGGGEEKSGGRKRCSMLADTLEALIGAVYIDSTFEHAQTVVLNLFAGKLAEPIESYAMRDFKTMLQEFTQEHYKKTPTYLFTGESGPDHSKTFVVQVIINEQILAKGTGPSKKKATQDAAENAWTKLKEKPLENLL